VAASPRRQALSTACSSLCDSFSSLSVWSSNRNWFLARQRLEASELFGQSLQARGRLAVGMRAVHELLLDALLRVGNPDAGIELGELDPHGPRRLAVEDLHREPRSAAAALTRV